MCIFFFCPTVVFHSYQHDKLSMKCDMAFTFFFSIAGISLQVEHRVQGTAS